MTRRPPGAAHFRKTSIINTDFTALDRQKALELAREEMRDAMEATPFTVADSLRLMFARRAIRSLEKAKP